MKTKDLIYCALFAALTAIGAFIHFQFMHATITLQCFFTAMAGLLLGARLGALSQALYVGLGLVGLPIFAAGGGFSYVFNPTFGFLLGLIPAAWVIGRLAEKNRTPLRLALACAAGFAVLYAIGLPSVVMMAIGSVMTFLMNKILITYHSARETAATAFGIYFKLNSFVFMPVFGLNNGVIPIIAYNYGAQQRRRMIETIKRSTVYASCVMVLGMVIFQLLPGTLLKIFKATDTMMSVGIPALRIISLSFCMAGACIALGGCFQALGKSMYSLIVSFIRQLVLLIPVAFVLAQIGHSMGNDNLVWWCYPIAEVFSLGVTLLCYRRLYRTLISKLPENGPEIPA